jgi:hypothetical protein
MARWYRDRDIVKELMRSLIFGSTLLSLALAASTAAAQAPPRPEPPAPQAPGSIYGWDDDQPVPPGYRKVTTRNGPMLGAGIALFSSMYSVSTASAAIGGAIDSEDLDGTSSEDWAVLYIPIAGPFLAVHTLDARPSGVGVLVSDGIFQVAGLALLLAGALDSETHLLRYSVVPIIQPRAGGGVLGVGARF